ncbi:hypothetical protein V8C86DRAFT_2960724 [Haematococcus lacustris]
MSSASSAFWAAASPPPVDCPLSRPGAGAAPLPAFTPEAWGGARGGGGAAGRASTLPFTTRIWSVLIWCTMACSTFASMSRAWQALSCAMTLSMVRHCSRCSGGVVLLASRRHSASGSPVRISAAWVCACRPCSGWARLSTSASSQLRITGSVRGSFTTCTTWRAQSGSVRANSTAPLCSAGSPAPPGSSPAATSSGRSASVRCSTGKLPVPSFFSSACTSGTGSWLWDSATGAGEGRGVAEGGAAWPPG